MTKVQVSRILVVDDEQYICDIVREALVSHPEYQIQTTADPRRAVEILTNEPVDLVLSDLIMGKITGVEILEVARKLHPDSIVILMTGQPTVENAVEVIKQGAYDYLIKPFTLETLRATVERGLERQRLARENVHLKEQMGLFRISEAMGSTIHLDQLLTLMLDAIIKEFDADMASILLVDKITGELKLNAFRGNTSDSAGSWFLLGHDEVCRWVVDNGLPKMVNEKQERRRRTSPGLKQNVKSFVCYPLLARGKVLGVLNVVRTEKMAEFSQGQLQSLGIIVSKAASAIESSMLYEELQDAYLDTIIVLANAIEARDSYTRLHTDRVRYLAELIARELGWPDARMREVWMGGILHDVGKIAVPDGILNKRGPLSPEEFTIMRQHPQTGAKMLESIPFLAPAIPFVLYHQERFDGTGYPFGLKGESIPIEGRLLSVVDTFDAVVSDRPYRRGRSFEEAITELVRCAGTQFDPHVVELFVKLWNEEKIDRMLVATGKVDNPYRDTIQPETSQTRKLRMSQIPVGANTGKVIVQP